jgi:hypothetical protein
MWYYTSVHYHYGMPSPELEGTAYVADRRNTKAADATRARFNFRRSMPNL